MKTSPRKLALIAALMIALAITDAWAAIHMRSAQSSATRAQQDSAECRKLATMIAAHRQSSGKIVRDKSQPVDLSLALDRAMAKAGISHECLIRVTPEEPTHLQNDQYAMNSTVVLMRDIALRQLVVFLCDVNGEENFRIKSIRLTAPRDEAEGPDERWTVEITVASLAYSFHKDHPYAREAAYR